jgi:SpoVK/Ycf46/Vps4 family AAA+-type ATPase
MIEFGVDATRIEPRATWSDLRLAEDQVLVLQDLCRQARRRRTGKPRVAREPTGGTAVTALFVGGGTAKTTAAEVIAGELGRDLYRIDLSAVVSKWADETEQHLDRLFELPNAVVWCCCSTRATRCSARAATGRTATTAT